MINQDVGVRLLSTRSYAQVADASLPEDALENVTTGKLANGCLCYVLSNGAQEEGLYVLDKENTDSVDGTLRVATYESSGGSSPGRWKLLAQLVQPV